jgi:hypothetical protein
LKTMCGSRTSGWLLPGVMSDWQHCVDWFLAKYYRCRLWLDWCWCRWRTSAKGHYLWGLQVWRRQVGLVRGTWWLAGSSAGHMVARTTRWSHGRFLGKNDKNGKMNSSGYVVLANLGSWVGDVCCKSCSSSWSLYLLQEEFLSAPFTPPLCFAVSVLHLPRAPRQPYFWNVLPPPMMINLNRMLGQFDRMAHGVPSRLYKKPRDPLAETNLALICSYNRSSH